MKLNRTLLSSALALALVAMSSVVAKADSVSYNSDSFLGISPFSTSLAVQKFNPSLGTLTGVSITVSAKAAGNIVVINYSNVLGSPTTEAFTNATASSLVTVSTSAGSSASASVNASTTGLSGNAAVGVNQYNGIQGVLTTSSAAVVGAGDFGLYTGPGGATIDVNVTSAPGVYSGSGNLVAFGGTTAVYTYATITYTYTPLAVPEPTSSAMFGIGIVLAVGLGWGRRRRELNKLAV